MSLCDCAILARLSLTLPGPCHLTSYCQCLQGESAHGLTRITNNRVIDTAKENSNHVRVIRCTVSDTSKTKILMVSACATK